MLDWYNGTPSTTIQGSGSTSDPHRKRGTGDQYTRGGGTLCRPDQTKFEGKLIEVTRANRNQTLRYLIKDAS